MKSTLNRAALGVAATGLLVVGGPFLLWQRANLGLLRAGPQTRRVVALTFDDGPDPRSTPAVLDALNAAGAQATFFVLAAPAEAHPDLIARMLREGHEVQAHAVRHRHAWLRTPRGAYRDPGDAAARIGAVIRQVGGTQPVTLHRPPHGAYSLFTRLGQRAAGLTGAHWSLEGQDWRAAQTPDGLRAHLRRALQPGAVIVLHDAGPGARVTVPALPGVLADLKARGYAATSLARLEDLRAERPADLPPRLMGTLDRLLDRLTRTEPAGDLKDSILRVSPTRFPGPDLTLRGSARGGSVPGGGLTLRAGVPAAEYHANNALMSQLGPVRTVRVARQDFRRVAADLQRRPELRGAQAVYCQSAVTPILERLGFETHDLPPATGRRLRVWANVLRRAYGSRAPAQEPKLSVLSREDFLRLYGEAPQ
ncbi:polysaccharide deacetylase family protein [Deinococcus knuensis]|uniref:Polysaccharide deacetylase familiy protein n=1 Tax=Deinococcus knuensis TaxID=1837380 RepID=A0ABQ2SGG7_9DEIO|nr:polysaccharide deacetylase family protein [Deinococcus knuensis]GGS23798.1 polysaccharide deacetylase familiy protein [Deinococcus knuensis]